MRSRACELKDHACVFFIDDKAKIPLGEPDNPVSTGIRGKSSLAPSTTTLSALDHNVSSKGHLTPSVILHPNIPDKVEKSWYQGKVRVTLHDAVFQQSDPFRYAAMLIRNVRELDEFKSIVFKFSDGGTERRNVLIKVQLSLIAVFKLLN